MNLKPIFVQSVGFWSSEFESFSDFCSRFPTRENHGKNPQCLDVSAGLKRKMTPLSKAVFESIAQTTSVEVAQKAVHFYVSQNSEIQVLMHLLEDWKNGLELSPTQFSHSVFHTPSGYLSLATKNTQLSRALSAGAKESSSNQKNGGVQSLGIGLLEAFLFLQENPSEDVLLSWAEEPFSHVLQKQNLSPYDHLFACSFYLSAHPTSQTLFKIELQNADLNQPITKAPESLFAFLTQIQQPSNIILPLSSKQYFSWMPY